MLVSMSDLTPAPWVVEPPLGMAGIQAAQLPAVPPAMRTIYGVLALASSGIGFYHGYLRNGGSVGWGLGWALMGTVMPVITPALAFAQGIGEPIRTTRNRRNGRYSCLECETGTTTDPRSPYCRECAQKHAAPERSAPRTRFATWRGSGEGDAGPGIEGALSRSER